MSGNTLRTAWVDGEFAGMIGEKSDTFVKFRNDLELRGHFDGHTGPVVHIEEKSVFLTFLAEAQKKTRIMKLREDIARLTRQLEAEEGTSRRQHSWTLENPEREAKVDSVRSAASTENVLVSVG